MTPVNSSRRRAFLWSGMWTALWLVLVVTALWTRPLMPVDETRYLAVAWEMWRDGDFIVPHLNGETYSHKPPLLFWLMNLGWAVFGVVEWWPRVVAPLFGLGAVFLTARLAHTLWPGDGAAAAMAPLILLGSVFWTLFTTLTMFDMILAFCTVLGLGGMVTAWRSGQNQGQSQGQNQGQNMTMDSVRGFALLGLGIGLGVLAKGPAILVHTLPVALLAPLWGPALGGNGSRPSWKYWYGGVAAAVIGGVALALLWAVPAGIKGGEAYREAIFWGQSAGRMVDSFAHGRPWWWYLAVLPPLVLPWVIWPPLLRALLRALRHFDRGDGGLVFCLSWFLPALVIFSLISGKQAHYLLPVFPALALIFARVLAAAEMKQGAKVTRLDQLGPAILMIVLGLTLALLPVLAATIPLPDQAGLLSGGWGWLLVVAGLAVLGPAAADPRTATLKRITALTMLSTVAIVVVHLAARPLLDAAYDLEPVALRLGQWEKEGRRLAHFGKYHGQFQFLGRLQNPMTVIGVQGNDEQEWLAQSPGGKIVSYFKKPPPGPPADYVRPFRRRFIAVWNTETVLAHPGITHRNQ